MKIMTYIYRIKCSSHDEYMFSKISKILSNFWYFQENTHSFYELHPVYTSCFTVFYALLLSLFIHTELYASISDRFTQTLHNIN